MKVRFLILSVALLISFFHPVLSEEGKLTKHQRDLAECNKNPPPAIPEIPGEDRFANGIFSSTCRSFDSNARKFYTQSVIQSPDFTENGTKQKLLEWYKSESQKTTGNLKADAQKRHFSAWVKLHYKYMNSRYNITKDRQRFLENQRKMEEYRRDYIYGKKCRKSIDNQWRRGWHFSITR